MIEGAIARRWARALLQLAQEENAVAEVREQLSDFAALLRAGDGELARVIESPSFSRSEKVAIVTDLAKARNALPRVRNFLALAITKDRARYLLPIIDEFDRLADTLTGVVKAELTVAMTIPDALVQRIRAVLETRTQQRVQLVVKTDPSLVGGAVLRFGSRVVDGSVRSQLETLSRRIAQTQ